jgi:hypothetical protein
MENRYIKDKDALEEIRKLDYYKSFSRFDEDGRLKIITFVYDVNITGKKKEIGKFKDREKFVELLPKAINEEGLLALMGICEQAGMRTWDRGWTLKDMLNEAEKIAQKNSDLKYPWFTYHNIKTLDPNKQRELYDEREFCCGNHCECTGDHAAT